MTIPPAFLDEIRARVALAAVVGRRVKLTRAGHEWKGCCPFHNEKTPSFYVNEDKGFYHCFGCGVHGDVIRFVTEQEGLSFPDAVRQLLGALPEGFPRPVLVRLQLDGGRYDRLVRQMERATAMPGQLAEAGMTVSPGEVYFLPPDLLPTAVKGELQFAETADVAGLADAVPADDSALLFLSGADAALVDVAMGPAWQGALVGGQSEEGCYDPGAARAVAQRGGPSGSPTDIADWLIARCMPSERHFDSGGLSL